jgi:hypothetical protein
MLRVPRPPAEEGADVDIGHRPPEAAIRSMITACVVMSSPVVGSSAINKAGSHVSAIAIITR